VLKILKVWMMLNYKFSNHELANMMRSCSYGEDLEVTCNSLFAPTVGYARGQLVVYKSSRYHGIRKNEPQSDLAERLGGRTYYAGLAMSRAYFAGLASHSIVVQSRRSNNTPDLPETHFIISENRDPSHSLPFPSPAERGTTPAPNAANLRCPASEMRRISVHHYSTFPDRQLASKTIEILRHSGATGPIAIGARIL
jgi:hypothetical protein